MGGGDESMKIIQWFFDLEVVCCGFNWPVNPEALVASKRTLDAAITEKAPAEEILKAYQVIAGAIGPTVMTALLESDDAFPEVNHSTKLTPPSPGEITLYVDPNGRRVLAECTKQWGIPAKLRVA